MGGKNAGCSRCFVQVSVNTKHTPAKAKIWTCLNLENLCVPCDRSHSRRAIVQINHGSLTMIHVTWQPFHDHGKFTMAHHVP